ncbi:MAG: hypothetical protein J6V99_00295 [Neisseriaceae bacterium]|nr:hypothetical protein [Neisseriaceae bacterium]
MPKSYKESISGCLYVAFFQNRQPERLVKLGKVDTLNFSYSEFILPT